MSTIDLDRLVAACSDAGDDAGITIRTELDPLAGPGGRVKPAVYAGGRFQRGRQWWGDGEDRRLVDVIMIDNVPSQANRLEASLELMSERLGLPEFRLDLTGLEPLPAHVPRTLSSFRFPHRNADAYLRDSLLDGVPFLKSDVGKALFDATGDRADALVQWFPQSLLFGFWQSHLGKKGSQAKLARSWVSEILGIDPAPGVETDGLTYVEGLKGDPLNLTKGGNDFAYDAESARWEPLQGREKPPFGSVEKQLSKLGHGQVPVGESDRALAAISFGAITQQATVSFASLRRVRTSVGEAEARALLVVLGLVAHVGAFGRSFNLRSGCDLRPTSTRWTWLGASGDEEIAGLSADEAVALFEASVARAEAAGLPVGSQWVEPRVLVPQDNLGSVIRTTYPEPNDD